MSSFLLHVCLIMTAVGTPTYSRPHKLTEPIGTGINVYVRVLYDNNTIPGNKIRGSKGTESVRMDQTFEKIFKEVEKKFHTYNIMISINVTKVKELKYDVRVPLNDTPGGLDGPKTLDKLVKLQQTRFVNNVIVYFFTRSSIYLQIGEDDNVPIPKFDVETRRTFCTVNTSAAVVMYVDTQPEDFAFRAATFIFGSTRYDYFERTDFEYMNETFEWCRRNEAAIAAQQNDR
uniref:28 kDa Metastriate family member n=1 Tax=Rhipicephalus zambeziensis TaxID=60191 RepID=A0A224Y0S1_9ACAR